MATTSQIEKSVKKVVDNFSRDNFIFDLLHAYDVANSRISRLRNGERNKLESTGELDASTLKLFFKVSTSNELYTVIDELSTKYKSEKKPPRFAIVTDYKILLAIDTKTDDTLEVEVKNLAKHYDFFLPLAGMEKSQIVDENPADVKAAEKMAKLYDEIVKDNAPKTEEEVHALNVFLTRLLFCYFAEDSNIFADNQFTNAIEQHTQNDGSDLDSYLDRLFELLNIEKRDSSLPKYLKEFPYVNGGLFKTKSQIPKFTMKSRRIMLEIGSLDWSEIHPDIFGSMIQAVITPEHRGGMGMHYTSVPNIMKVIEPLFLDALYEEFENSKTSKTKLQKLLDRFSSLKIFDPACGSGNFLIIAYKELRSLEIKILQQINKLSNMKQGELFDKSKKPEQLSFLSLSSNIKLTQFYGIELDDFAHEVAILSLWLTEHQMNIRFYKEFGQTAPPLPLPEGGHIVHGNATRLNWEDICPKEPGDEIYILGNPPYLGSKNQSIEQKEDMDEVFEGFDSYKKLDYISCWFKLASDYIYKSDSCFSFVSTNSIVQGEQVSLLWPYIFQQQEEISFAHQSFHWNNNAKGNAGVTVVIIGIRNVSLNKKYIYKDSMKQEVKNISPYLIEGSSLAIISRKKTLSSLPEMVRGSQPTDNGNLILSVEEKSELLKEEPNANKFIKRYMGADDFINGRERYCLWITDEYKDEALKIEMIKNRVNLCKNFRLASKKEATRRKAETAYKFDETKHKNINSIVFPTTSSYRRKYIPVGFMTPETVISNSAFVAYDSSPVLFGILSSRMNVLWISIVGSRMRNDYRYSVTLCYNNFPFPNVSEIQKEQLVEHVFNILNEREKYSEKTLGQLYDPDKMPEGLKEAHHQLDLAIERCYRKKPFTSDEERLEYLFELYEKMVSNGGTN